MAQTQEPVAVLGIGAMGHGMATSAMRAGIPTIVWNRNPEPTRDLAEFGAEVAETAADAARRAGIVVTMVTDIDAVMSIARDQGLGDQDLTVVTRAFEQPEGTKARHREPPQTLTPLGGRVTYPAVSDRLAFELQGDVDVASGGVGVRAELVRGHPPRSPARCREPW
jgi:threonine dehydrogenase-like Zn-dependent dehydrogenase